MWNERTQLGKARWRMLGQGIGTWGRIAVAAVGIRLVCRYFLRLAEPEGLVLTQRQKKLLGILAGSNGILLYLCRDIYGGKEGKILFFAAWVWLAGALLAAAVMDAKTCYVYNYVWYGSLPALILLQGEVLRRCCIQAADNAGAAPIFYAVVSRHIAPVLAFVLLQQLLFARLYGRADCHAFSVCAVAVNALGGGMLEFLIHMLLSVTLLAVVQAARGNISRRGCLITPQPFLPYIVLTFWGTVLGQAFR